MAGFLNQDLFDDPMESLFGQKARQRRAAAAYRQPMPEEEAASAGQALLNAGKGGLSQLLGVLNKPGRAVRGLVGGKPQEALAILPLSDTFGITNPENEVTGAKLNEKLGLKNDNSWTSWGAGLATELATDPLTYATFGAKHALTTAGKAAQASGALAKVTRKQAVEQGLGQLAKIKLPGLPEVGTGRFGSSVAGAIDKGVDKAVYGNPVGLKLNQLFNYATHRAGTALGQKAMIQGGEPAAFNVERMGRQLGYDLSKHVNDLAAANPTWNPADIERAITMRTEGVMPSDVLKVDPAIWEATAPGGQRLGSHYDQLEQRSKVMGTGPKSLADNMIDYMFRKYDNPEGLARNSVQPESKSIFGVGHGSHISRKDAYSDIPGGTEMLRKWSVEKPNALNVFKDMYLQAGVDNPNILQEIEESLPAWGKKAEQVANKIANLPGGFTHEKPMFSRNITETTNLRTARQAMAERNTAAWYEAGKLGAQPGRLKKTKGTKATAEGISLPAFLKLGGLRTTAAKDGEPMAGALVQMAEKLGIDTTPYLHGPNKDLIKVLKNYHMKRADVEGLLKPYTPWKLPTELQGPVKAVDSITNSFRNLAYSIWPASQTRNLMGGIVQTASRPGSEGLIGTVKDVARQAKIMRGTATPEEISKWTGGRVKSLDEIRKAQVADADIHSGHSVASTELSQGPASLAKPSDIVGPTPGEGFRGSGNIASDTASLLAQGLRDTASRTKDKLLGKLDRPLFEQQGVTHLPLWENFAGNLKGMLRGEKPRLRGQLTEGAQDFPWLETGRRLGYNVEFLLRGAQHLSKTRQGFSPAQIADEIWKTHFAYNRLTPFEKNVMRRAVPFYTFMSRNLPLQVENLTTKPGNTMPWLRLGVNNNPNQFVPRHLAGGVAVPLSNEDPATGNQQFLSQAGLPIEEFAERFKFDQGVPDVRNTVAAFAGALNPLVKGPLEMLFDKQLYSGRKLSDLKPQGVVGMLSPFAGDDTQGIVAQALANSPATRVLSTIDKIADPRKAWWAKALNLTTGLRVTDVDMQKMRAIETRQALEELLRKNPHVSQYTNFYVRPEDKLNLTTEDTEKLQLMSRLQSNAQRHAREQRMKMVQIR